MNQGRKETILKIKMTLAELHYALAIQKDQEREFLKNIPENLQDGTLARLSTSAILSMDDAMDSIQNAIENCYSITQY
jgi:hypothetical protein